MTRWDEAVEALRSTVEAEANMYNVRINGVPGSGDIGAIEAHCRVIENKHHMLRQAVTSAAVMAAVGKEALPAKQKAIRAADAEPTPRGLEAEKTP
jgi:hypothetical protein